MACRKKLNASTFREYLLLFNACSVKEAEFLD
jgi:hypothetical protein